jgi:hypothetical protein
MLTLELGDGIVVELAFVTVAFAQSPPHPGQRLVTERDPFQQAREPLLQHFLARIRLRALSLESGAVVVDVAALLDLAHHGAAAVAAGDQAAEGELLLHLARLLGAAPVEDRLDLLPQLAGHDSLVGAVVHRAVEVEIAGVNPVTKDLVNGGGGHRIATLPVRQPIGAGCLGHLL